MSRSKWILNNLYYHWNWFWLGVFLIFLGFVVRGISNLKMAKLVFSILLFSGVLVVLASIFKPQEPEKKKERPEKPGHSKKGKEIGVDMLLKLYKVHSEDQISHLDSHYKYRNYYTTILSALLTIFMGGMLRFSTEAFAPALLVILLCIGVLSELGKKTIDRYYRRFLESVTILAKIENSLGFDHSIKTDKSRFAQILWPSDKALIPDRWIRDRDQYDSSEDFISKRMKMGDNRYAHWTFSFFQIIGAILALSSILVFLQVYSLFN